jgi:hypothetical protein
MRFFTSGFSSNIFPLPVFHTLKCFLHITSKLPNHFNQNLLSGVDDTTRVKNNFLATQFFMLGSQKHLTELLTHRWIWSYYVFKKWSLFEVQKINSTGSTETKQCH